MKYDGLKSHISNEHFGGPVAILFRMICLVAAALTLTAFIAVAQDEPNEPDRSGKTIELPNGEGKVDVQRACGLCHSLNRIAEANFDRDDWDELVHRMVSFGAPMKKERIPVVIDYLASNFKGEGRPVGEVIPGSVNATVKEWPIPTPGSRPHDAYFAPDGYVWYTGNMVNLIGRFDPKSEQFKEFPLKHSNSGPNGLVSDRAGNIWFTAETGAYIGKLNPKTGAVTEFPLQDSSLILHTPIFDQKGVLFFTVLIGNKVGRLNPKTGEIKLGSVPTPMGDPYGIVVNSKGVPFFTERDAPNLGSIDPETMEVTEYRLPNPKIGPRRIAVDSKDVVWYTDSGRGYLGRYDPKSGSWKEWPSPSGPRSFPYGINVVKDIVWYAEAEAKPNLIVRFDPMTEKFQTWRVPSGGGRIRMLSPAPNGDLWFVGGGSNTLGVVHFN